MSECIPVDHVNWLVAGFALFAYALGYITRGRAE